MRSTAEQANTLEAIIQIAEKGYPVIPVQENSKTPLITQWPERASRDVTQIQEWFTSYPGANVGITTNGLLVIDVDPVEGQENPFLQTEMGKTISESAGAISITPRGKHFFSKQPVGRRFQNSVSKIARGVDIRADRGFVVVPPSRVDVKNGISMPYSWQDDRELPPIDILPEFDSVVLDFLENALSNRATSSSTSPELSIDTEIVPEGRRNEMLFRKGCQLKGKKVDTQDIRLFLKAANQSRCLPPLSEVEVERIYIQVESYADVEAPHENFPVESLPIVCKQIVTNCSEAFNVDPSGVALLMLAVMAGVVGASAKIKGKEGWFETASLWCMLVGESGDGKSPIINFLKGPIDEIDCQEFMSWKIRNKAWEIRKEEHARSGRRRTGPVVNSGPEPRCPRLAICDSTVEAIISALADNSAGVSLLSDELSGWMTGFGGYKQNRQDTEIGFFNQCYSGGSYRYLRKSSPEIFLPNPQVSIAGCIQPGVLREALSNKHVSSGLWARFIVTYPPRLSVRWTDRGVDEVTRKNYRDLIRQCLLFRTSRTRADLETSSQIWRGNSNLVGLVEPMVFLLSRQSQDCFRNHYNQLGAEQELLGSELISAWSKLPGTTLRVALVLHLMEWASSCQSDEPTPTIQMTTFENAISIINWVKSQNRRIYAAMGVGTAKNQKNTPLPDLERKKQEIMQKIIVAGNAVHFRDFYKSKTNLSSTTAEEIFKSLEEDGFGRFEERVTQHGQKSKWFVRDYS